MDTFFHCPRLVQRLERLPCTCERHFKFMSASLEKTISFWSLTSHGRHFTACLWAMLDVTTNIALLLTSDSCEAPPDPQCLQTFSWQLARSVKQGASCPTPLSLSDSWRIRLHLKLYKRNLIRGEWVREGGWLVELAIGSLFCHFIHWRGQLPQNVSSYLTP